MKLKIKIVGAGIGGLAAAALLARDGYDVTVLEKNSGIGGRARVWRKEGFTFDMGPSWYLMPEVFEDFFQQFDAKRENYYSLQKLDPAYTVFFQPGESVQVHSDPVRVKELFESFEPGGGLKLEEYLKNASKKYSIAVGEFLYKNYSSLFDFLNRKLLLKGPQLNVFRSLDKVVGKYFSDRRARQILEYGMVFLGTSPRDAPALYSIMSHMDLNQGAFYPSGGLAQIPLSLAKLAESMGARIETDVTVEKIEVDARRRVKGIRTNRGNYDADAVVVNADYSFAETHLLEPVYQSYPLSWWKKRVWAPSMFILYLGLNKRLSGLTHHNLYFSADWNDHFRQIFSEPAWPADPCFYVSCISKTDPGAAPEGGENVFVLVPVAPGLDDDDELRERYAGMVISHIEKITGETLKDSIVVKRIYSQRDFSEDYNAYQGTALGLAHTLGQTAVFRPSMRSKKVGNLYYTGQYTHPGVGVPMVLIAARITDALVREDLSSHA